MVQYLSDTHGPHGSGGEEREGMLEIWIGRARTGKSERILERIRELGDASEQILLVPEHASHQAEVDLCMACGDGAPGPAWRSGG